ncbi:hypothetical protein M7I_0885 [Glarea lozoyensis 74030]|uniref:Uncharacterized protein n=1 Tax=Glarea lozoyensis (strain ATCC 74030 / MF5533) TaxID=1104152 RepID=H0EEK6_GLAL7|nr:hypothetical protein M7I_0885 [Glarea lozoyensis 74030]
MAHTSGITTGPEYESQMQELYEDRDAQAAEELREDQEAQEAEAAEDSDTLSDVPEEFHTDPSDSTAMPFSVARPGAEPEEHTAEDDSEDAEAASDDDSGDDQVVAGHDSGDDEPLFAPGASTRAAEAALECQAMLGPTKQNSAADEGQSDQVQELDADPNGSTRPPTPVFDFETLPAHLQYTNLNTVSQPSQPSQPAQLAPAVVGPAVASRQAQRHSDIEGLNDMYEEMEEMREAQSQAGHNVVSASSVSADAQMANAVAAPVSVPAQPLREVQASTQDTSSRAIESVDNTRLPVAAASDPKGKAPAKGKESFNEKTPSPGLFSHGISKVSDVLNPSFGTGVLTGRAEFAPAVDFPVAVLPAVKFGGDEPREGRVEPSHELSDAEGSESKPVFSRMMKKPTGRLPARLPEMGTPQFPVQQNVQVPVQAPEPSQALGSVQEQMNTAADNAVSNVMGQMSNLELQAPQSFPPNPFGGIQSHMGFGATWNLLHSIGNEPRARYPNRPHGNTFGYPHPGGNNFGYPHPDENSFGFGSDEMDVDEWQTIPPHNPAWMSNPKVGESSSQVNTTISSSYTAANNIQGFQSNLQNVGSFPSQFEEVFGNDPNQFNLDCLDSSPPQQNIDPVYQNIDPALLSTPAGPTFDQTTAPYSAAMYEPMVMDTPEVSIPNTPSPVSKFTGEDTTGRDSTPVYDPIIVDAPEVAVTNPPAPVAGTTGEETAPESVSTACEPIVEDIPAAIIPTPPTRAITSSSEETDIPLPAPSVTGSTSEEVTSPVSESPATGSTSGETNTPAPVSPVSPISTATCQETTEVAIPVSPSQVLDNDEVSVPPVSLVTVISVPDTVTEDKSKETDEVTVVAPVSVAAISTTVDVETRDVAAPINPTPANATTSQETAAAEAPVPIASLSGKVSEKADEPTSSPPVVRISRGDGPDDGYSACKTCNYLGSSSQQTTTETEASGSSAEEDALDAALKCSECARPLSDGMAQLVKRLAKEIAKREQEKRDKRNAKVRTTMRKARDFKARAGSTKDNEFDLSDEEDEPNVRRTRIAERLFLKDDSEPPKFSVITPTVVDPIVVADIAPTVAPATTPATTPADANPAADVATVVAPTDVANIASIAALATVTLTTVSLAAITLAAVALAAVPPADVQATVPTPVFPQRLRKRAASCPAILSQEAVDQGVVTAPDNVDAQDNVDVAAAVEPLPLVAVNNTPAAVKKFSLAEINKILAAVENSPLDTSPLVVELLVIAPFAVKFSHFLARSKAAFSRAFKIFIFFLLSISIMSGLQYLQVVDCSAPTTATSPIAKAAMQASCSLPYGASTAKDMVSDLEQNIRSSVVGFAHDTGIGIFQFLNDSIDGTVSSQQTDDPNTPPSATGKEQLALASQTRYHSLQDEEAQRGGPLSIEAGVLSLVLT